MRAFTLVEVIVLIAVTGLLGLTINSLIANFYRSNAYLLQETSAIDSAHRGLRTSFEDLREASYGEDGSYPIQSAGTSSITFFTDLNGDGSTERIRLYLYNGSFYRVVTQPTSTPPTYTGGQTSTTTIATYIRNASTTPIFSYYDGNGTQLATSSAVNVSQISSVTTSLLIDLNPLRAPDILTLTETATLRNLR